MAYGPAAPPVLPDNADEQRRQISDYIRSAPAAEVTGQGFVNNTNTNVLTSIQKNNNLAPDDLTKPSTTVTQQSTNTAGNLNSSGFVTPQANVLDNFASTTWTASVYLLSPTQYTELIRSKKKRVNGYNLLFQSGGAPNNTGGFQGAANPGFQARTNAEGGNQSVAPGVPGSSGPDAGRNPAFEQDFYIDSVTFDNALPGKQTQMAHSVFDLKFTVVEPGNITLLDRIYAAVQDMAQTTGKTNQINYTAAQYLMVMRWYGYDINGNLVAGKTAPGEDGISDTNAIVEKFIPFLIKKINWSVTSKLVSYDFECAPVGQLVAGGTRRGTIPYDVQLTAQTVEGLLTGPVIYANGSVAPANRGASTTYAGGLSSARLFNQQRDEAVNNQSSSYTSPKANAAPKPLLESGLTSAMSVFASDLVSVEKVYKAADTYSVVFADNADDIKNAEIRLPGAIVSQSELSMGTAPSQNANQALNNNTGPIQIRSRKWAITAGMQMVQAIDLAIRNSSYIYNQALTVYDQETGEEKPNPKAQGKPVSWFKITMQATPSEYDEARNDFAYDITYVISKYEIPNFDSKYFPIGKFRGVHKSYPYWFTGQNTAVLDFTANFNAAYNMTISGGPDINSGDAELRKRLTSNTRDQMIYSYAARSQESNKGADAKGNEVGANAAEYLYAYSEPGGSKIRIIGDPAWIQQGSLCGGVTSADLSDSPFSPDGTINFDSSQVLFEIAWQRPEDYNINTGLADPYARPGNTPGTPQQTNTYQATKVSNEFRGGKFEQVITGVLYMIPIPQVKKDDLRNAEAGMSRGTRSTNTSQPEDDSANRARDAEAGTSRGTRPQAFNGTGTVNASTSAYVSAGRLAASSQTGTPTVPSFNLGAVSAIPSTFTAAPIKPADVLLPAQYPQAPTGSGVNTLTSQGAPLPLNTTLQNVRQRIQQIVKDS
jgi:hypothetical protein